MGIGYQRKDFEIVDYNLYKLPGTSFFIRGPERWTVGESGYFAALGAAQTFGRFCSSPFPEKLERELGIPGLNLGHAGAGPSDFLRHASIIKFINDAECAIVQVLSGRSVNNSYFTCPSGGVVVRADGRDGDKPVLAADAYRDLLKNENRSFVKRIVEETRDNWLKGMRDLLKSITVPKILFWFSVRTPRYRENYDTLHGLFGEFPQFVNEEMIMTLKEDADYYVECVTSRGLPQSLVSRWDGSPVPIYKNNPFPHHNLYYPSPEMHEDAAAALKPVVRELMVHCFPPNDDECHRKNLRSSNT